MENQIAHHYDRLSQYWLSIVCCVMEIITYT